MRQGHCIVLASGTGAKDRKKPRTHITCHYERISVTMDGYNGDMVTITSIHVALLIILIYSGQESIHLYCRYAPACVLGTHECCVSYHHGLGALPFLVRVPFFPWPFLLFTLSFFPFTLFLFLLLLLSS